MNAFWSRDWRWSLIGAATGIVGCVMQLAYTGLAGYVIAGIGFGFTTGWFVADSSHARRYRNLRPPTAAEVRKFEEEQVDRIADGIEKELRKRGTPGRIVKDFVEPPPEE